MAVCWLALTPHTEKVWQSLTATCSTACHRAAMHVECPSCTIRKLCAVSNPDWTAWNVIDDHPPVFYGRDSLFKTFSADSLPDGFVK